jgi:hypothetical protein
VLDIYLLVLCTVIVYITLRLVKVKFYKV